MSAPEHLIFNENININNLKNTMNQNIDTYDKIVDELYNYNQYNQHKYYNDDHEEINNYDDKYIEANKNNELIQLLMSNADMQNELVNILDKESDSIQKTYNKSADMYRNQKFMNDVIEEELDVLERKINPITESVNNNKRQIQISTYYYLKNKAQLRLLYYFIITCFIILVIHVLHKTVSFIINDTIYSILIGFILAIFTIFFIHSCIDILLRDEHVFDEYKMNDLNESGTKIRKVNEKPDYSLCIVE